jgi:hypothetical protein
MARAVSSGQPTGITLAFRDPERHLMKPVRQTRKTATKEKAGAREASARVKPANSADRPARMTKSGRLDLREIQKALKKSDETN